MCPPVTLTEDESVGEPNARQRAAARERAAGCLFPGARVEVVPRIIVSGPPKEPSNFSAYQQSYTLLKLALWQRPSSEGPFLARQWRERMRSAGRWDYKRMLEEHKGPVLLRGERATVVAVLPEVECEVYGHRPWALLLADDGRLGWCYALDGLKLLEELSPAGGV